MSISSLARRHFLVTTSALTASAWLTHHSHAQEKSTDKSTTPDPKQYQDTVTKASDFLRVKGQAADGSFSK